jgi:molecular chaperone GrpE
MAPADDTQDEPLAQAAEPTAPDGPQSAAGASPSEAEAEIARARDDYLARWQRAAADYKNLRRRTADEIEAAVRRATLPLLSNLLLVLDHLELALQTTIESADARAFSAGVKLTRDQFLQVLQQNGIESFEAQGSFDPARHEAVATRDEPGREPGAILGLVRRGYTWRGQVLRHAHVIVARGPSESAPSATDAESAPESSPEAHREPDPPATS